MTQNLGHDGTFRGLTLTSKPIIKIDKININNNNISPSETSRTKLGQSQNIHIIHKNLKK